MLVATGAVVVAAMAAGITTTLHAASATPTSPSGLPPLTAVTSALTRTSAHSYTFSLDTVVNLPKRKLNSDAVSGTYDPGKHLGTELLTAYAGGQTSRAQIRFIGGYLYTSVTPGSGFGKPWDKTPLMDAADAAMPPGDIYGFVSDQVVRPSALGVVLRSPGATVHDSGPVSGQGWTGAKYTFTASLYRGLESVSGMVDVDAQGRVRHLATITARKGESPQGKVLLTTKRDITFSGFGSPVRVSEPPASQVKSTSGKPYWGFYF